jgi:hypothetical protein
VTSALRIGGRDHVLDDDEAHLLESQLQQVDAPDVVAMTLIGELAYSRTWHRLSDGVEPDRETLEALRTALLGIERGSGLTPNLKELLAATTTALGD